MSLVYQIAFLSVYRTKNLIEQTLKPMTSASSQKTNRSRRRSHYIQLQLENVSKPCLMRFHLQASIFQLIRYKQLNIQSKWKCLMNLQLRMVTKLQMSLQQDSVTLTGSTSDIESVSQVYTVVNIPDNLSEDYTTTATVITENADGDILNINTDPSELT